MWQFQSNWRSNCQIGIDTFYLSLRKIAFQKLCNKFSHHNQVINKRLIDLYLKWLTLFLDVSFFRWEKKSLRRFQGIGRFGPQFQKWKSLRSIFSEMLTQTQSTHFRVNHYISSWSLRKTCSLYPDWVNAQIKWNYRVCAVSLLYVTIYGEQSGAKAWPLAEPIIQLSTANEIGFCVRHFDCIEQHMPQVWNFMWNLIGHKSSLISIFRTKIDSC